MLSLTSTSENMLLRIHFEVSEGQVESRYWFDDFQLDVLNMMGQLEPHPPRLACQTLPLQEGRVWYNAISGFVPAAKNLVGQLDCRIMLRPFPRSNITHFIVTRIAGNSYQMFPLSYRTSGSRD